MSYYEEAMKRRVERTNEKRSKKVAAFKKLRAKLDYDPKSTFGFVGNDYLTFEDEGYIRTLEFNLD